MVKSSIHFRNALGTSEGHNKREKSMPHVYEELTKNNESWVQESMRDRNIKIRLHCFERSGRHMRSDANPFREAVVNLERRHTMQDLKELAKNLRDNFHINCFQIYIHRDEGKSKDELNYHAHMLFDWQDKAKGKLLRLGRSSMVEMQTVVADSLGMERGKYNSQAERLEAQAYKATKDLERATKDLEKAQKELASIEKKKRRVSLKEREPNKAKRASETAERIQQRAVQEAEKLEKESKLLQQEAQELEDEANEQEQILSYAEELLKEENKKLAQLRKEEEYLKELYSVSEADIEEEKNRIKLAQEQKKKREREQGHVRGM